MAFKVSGRIVFLVISLTIVLAVLSWNYWLESISWSTFSGNPSEKDVLKDSISPITAVDLDDKNPMPVLSISSFKKLPRFDFEEVYDMDSKSKQTFQTCAQSLRNSEDQDFKKAFLPDIGLFLHKDSINMSKWNQLSHFNNPFGFMGFRYNDVMPAVKLIPKPIEPLLSPKPGSDGCVRCAVVAAAGILNGSKMGKEIDSHDYVFRMNGAVIKGYEEDVGNRTSVYVHTAYSITTSLREFKQYGYTSVPADKDIKFVLIPEGMSDFSWLKALAKQEKTNNPRELYAGKYNESRFYVLHQDFLRYVRNRFLMSAHLNDALWAIASPSTGAFSLFLALHTCDTVSAYGFMTENYKKFSNYYVQKVIKTRVDFFAHNDYIQEMKLWKKMHQSKIIRLYERL